MSRVTIIAEAGVNHNGSVDVALQLIDAAKAAGADIVKFQTFRADRIVTRKAERAEYQIRNVGGIETQWEMIKRLELPYEAFKELKEACNRRGIEFLSTPGDEESVRFLVEEVGLKRIKVPSGEVTNLPFLHYISEFHLPVILSTGMSDLNEIECAVNILSEELSREQITLLHCTTSYPCPFNEVHLRAMGTLREKFGVKVGYSDHTRGIEVAIAAVGLGACVIEKHFSLDRNMPGPDHRASVEPNEFHQMVQSIRNVETALGQKEKKPTPSELRIRKVVRRSLVLAKSLVTGTILKREHLLAKRPADGISPAEIDRFIGCRLRVDKSEDDLIQWSDVEKVG